MAVGNKAVKVTAKTYLKENFILASLAGMLAVFATLICILLSEIPYYFSVDFLIFPIFLVLFLFLLLPIYLGTVRYFWHILFDIKNPFTAVFYYLSSFENYKKAIKFIFKFFSKIFLIGILIFLPAIIVWVISQPFIYEIFDFAIPVWTVNFKNVVVILRTVTSVAFTIFLLKYYLAPVIFIADETLDVDEVILMAKTVAKKSSIEFISLFFSFFGWILISFFVVPLFYTLPYILISYVIHCRYSMADYNMFVKNKLQTENFNDIGNLL